MNELYIQWLKEWRDKAYEVQSKGYKTLRTAHQSMVDCPLEIGHPSQAAQLKGIGPILCARLEKAMLAHCKTTGEAMPERHVAPVDEAAPAKKPRKQKQYVPAVRSGAYALLMALSEPSTRPNVTKSELIQIAGPFCDTSFEVASDKNSYYTAWNSMKTLKDKDLVLITGNPPKYNISPDGAEVARRMRHALDPKRDVTQEDVEVEEIPEDYVEIPPAEIQSTILKPGTFKIQMIIDNREVKSPKDRKFIEDQLFMSGIDLVTKSLDVGDVLWVAKSNDGNEYVLDHIVERKRMDDLLNSIKDGRFHEQKFRLKRSGSKHIIYLIEETHMTDVPHYQESIASAISSTQVVNGFFVKRVPSLDYSVRYLCRLTQKLKSLYEPQTLYILPDHVVDSRTIDDLMNRLEQRHYLSYHAFSSISKKSQTLRVGDIWLKMLLTIRGVSLEKALSIQKVFPTLRDLLDGYSQCGDDRAREGLLQARCSGYGRKSIGLALSRKVYTIFK